MIDRVEFLNGLIGMPWVANAKGPDAYDCYHLTQHVQETLFNRSMPLINVPEDPSWNWIINEIQRHPERRNWREVPVKNGLVEAADGSIVLMGASVRAAHLGVWFKHEMSILHTDNPDGVMFQDLMSIRMMGWQRLIFLEHV